MIQVADRYSVEVEWASGEITRKRGEIEGAMRVSLVPAKGLTLPRHDFVGQQFVKCWMRHFKRFTVGGFDKEKYLAELEKNVTSFRLKAREVRDEKGKKPELPPPQLKPLPKFDEAIHVIQLQTARIHIRHLDGSIIITPPNYELRL